MSNKLLLFLLPITILDVPVVYSFTPSSSNNRCAVAQVCVDRKYDVSRLIPVFAWNRDVHFFSPFISLDLSPINISLPVNPKEELVADDNYNRH